jgi:hypothetical protein
MLPPTKWRFPTPDAAMHPHTTTLPPCWTNGQRLFAQGASPGIPTHNYVNLIQKHYISCLVNKANLVHNFLSMFIFFSPPGAWMFVCSECCVLSGRGLCDELITRPEESYRLWCVVVCDLEISRTRRPWPALGRRAAKKNFFSLHVSGDYVPIIRRNNRIYATLGTCYFVRMTVWYAGCNLHTRQSSIQNNK